MQSPTKCREIFFGHWTVETILFYMIDTARTPIQFRGETYRTISIFRAQIPRVVDPKDLARFSGPPLVVRSVFDRGHLELLSYKDAVLPPSPETYSHALVLARGIKQMLTDTTIPHPLVIADIGTGSGIIALTLAQQLKEEVALGEVAIVATDILGTALTVAETNATLNRIKGVQFRQRDVLEGLTQEFGKLDVIISNCPFYHADRIPRRHRRSGFIPRVAIDGGYDSFDFYRRLFSQAKAALSDRGILMVQHQEFQGPMLQQLAYENLRGVDATLIPGQAKRPTALVIGDPRTVAVVAQTR